MKKIIVTIHLIAASLPLLAQNVLAIKPGAVFSTTSGAVITLSDLDLVNNGTITPGQSTFVFAGTGNNTFTGIATIDTLRIAKKGSASLSLQNTLNINSAIQFDSGFIDLNGNNILLQPGALLNNESATSYITGPGGGYVQVTVPLNAPNAANPGHLGAVITTTQNLGNTVIRRGHVPQNSPTGTASSIARYYDIGPTNDAGLDATLRMYYSYNELNGLDPTTLALYKTEDGTNWSPQGFTNRSTNYVEVSGIDKFSRWTLSSLTNPLPLQFLSFKAQCGNETITLDWTTAQEQHTGHFTVQRSIDGTDWDSIGEIKAAGNSTAPTTYTYTDAEQQGKALYRLAETDLDGRENFSPIATADCRLTTNIKAWPNPVKDNLTLEITATETKQAAITIYDSKGALLTSQQQTLSAGINQVWINMSSYPPGVYHLNTGTKTIQILKIAQ